MHKKIIKISDGRVYRCAECPYRNRDVDYCGFCLRKVLDDKKKSK